MIGPRAHRRLARHNEFGWWLDDTEARMDRTDPEDTCKSSSTSSSSLNLEDEPPDHGSFLIDEAERVGLASLFEVADDDGNVGAVQELEQVYNQDYRVGYGVCYAPESVVRSGEFRIVTPPSRYGSPEFLGGKSDESCSPKTYFISMKFLERSGGELLNSNTRTGEEASDSDKCQCNCDCARRKRYQSTDPRSKYVNGCYLCPCWRKDYNESDLAQQNQNRSSSTSRSAESPSLTRTIDLNYDWDHKGTLLGNRWYYYKCCCHQCLTKLDLNIAAGCHQDYEEIDLNQEDTSMTLQEMQWNVERKQDSYRTISEEIALLKKDFTTDEWKVDSLLEVTKKLRSELFEVRYLNELLHLLEGEIERVSPKHWPFAVNNAKVNRDEINLVI